MRNKINSLSMIFIVSLLITGCGKSDAPQTPPKPTPVVPGKATLTFPLQNSACTTGTVVSNTQSSVTFSWSVSDHTESYQVEIKNLLNGATISQNVTSSQATVTLARNTPYAWHVTSKTSQSATTTSSDTWKFYNSGLGTLFHPPFPAEATSPLFGQNLPAAASTNLTWTGSDADNDIAGYEVYFGTTANPPLLKGDIKDMFLNSVTISSGNTYYWKVVTKDQQGNTSDSDVFQFTVK